MSELTRRDFLRVALLAGLAAGSSRFTLPPLTGSARGMGAPAGSPNVLIVVFDTLSARHMSLHGYQRETTPHLARFAERATLYHRHYASGNFTSPGTASLLTGTYPWTHRAFHLHSIVEERFAQANLFHSFAQAGYYQFAYTHNLLVASLLQQFRADLDLFKRTRELCLSDDELADRLFPEDYNVAFWSEWMMLRGGKHAPGGLFSSLVDRVRRYVHKSENVGDFGELFPRGLPNLHSLTFLPEHAVDWLVAEVQQAPQPFLGYVHLLPPHEPYTTRRDFVDRFADGWAPTPKPTLRFSQRIQEPRLAEQRRWYDEYLAYADAEFGRLLSELERVGTLDNTILLFTSDHGELFERGIRGHVTPTLYEPILRVPLLVALPGQRERVDVHAPTSAVDLLPTLLHAIGAPVPAGVEGRLLPGMGGEADPARPIFAMDAKSNAKRRPLEKATVALITEERKLVRYLGYGAPDGEELYDLASDPEERADVAPALPAALTSMRAALDEALHEANAPFRGS